MNRSARRERLTSGNSDVVPVFDIAGEHSHARFVLREFKQLRQEPGPGSRRWFESDGFDLVIWTDAAGAFTGFQICYDFGDGEHALTWRRGGGCTHHRVDPGDHTPFANLTPILVADGVIPWPEILRTFNARCGSLEPAIRDAVQTALMTRGPG